MPEVIVRWDAARIALTLTALVFGSTCMGAGQNAFAAGEDCAQLISRFSTAINAARLPDIVQAGTPILTSGSCPAGTRSEAGRRIALFHLVEAEKLGDQPGDDLEKRKLLLAGAEFAKPWQLMAALGDVHRAIKDSEGKADYQLASIAYQNALLDINDARAVPTPPQADVIARLIQLSQQCRLLASRYTPLSGALTRDFRGVTVEAVAMPIQFVRDSSAMTPQGLAYSEELSAALHSQGRPAITLVGHTDPEGAAKYNDALSLRRAAAVRDFLVQKGYRPATITVVGNGSRDPLKIVDERQYTQAQIYQMNRRVEVRFR